MTDLGSGSAGNAAGRARATSNRRRGCEAAAAWPLRGVDASCTAVAAAQAAVVALDINRSLPFARAAARAHEMPTRRPIPRRP